MNKSTGYVIAVLVFAILASYLAVNFFVKEQTKTVKWEYQIISYEDAELFKSLNSIGSEGWELAFARRAVSGEGYSSKGVYECIFKKPKVD